MSASGTPVAAARPAPPAAATDDGVQVASDHLPPGPPEDKPQSGLSIAVRVVGLWIVLPIVVLFLAKMLLL